MKDEYQIFRFLNGGNYGFLQCGCRFITNHPARFDHPKIAPIIELGDRLILELFWGPTLSFKDHALQVVARLLDHETEGGTILGATSGDTGSAAIEACRSSHHLNVVILFPDGLVSDFQRRQMTTVPDVNVSAVAVRGNFDDCQALVKQAFTEKESLLAINSINWARIAAQVGYYVYAGAFIGEPFDVAVPTGNFGNVYSCWMAKQMGVPIETIDLRLLSGKSAQPLEGFCGAPGPQPTSRIRRPGTQLRSHPESAKKRSAER